MSTLKKLSKSYSTPTLVQINGVYFDYILPLLFIAVIFLCPNLLYIYNTPRPSAPPCSCSVCGSICLLIEVYNFSFCNTYPQLPGRWGKLYQIILMFLSFPAFYSFLLVSINPWQYINHIHFLPLTNSLIVYLSLWE